LAERYRADMSEETISSYLGRNIRMLRDMRGLTQNQLAKISGVPRPTWANLETGVANPTLSILLRVATALQVSVQELLDPPRAVCRLYPSKDLPKRIRGMVEVGKILPDSIPGLEIDRMDFRPQAELRGIPHKSGTREYLTCELGAVELRVAGNLFALKTGDVAVFRGDQPHHYKNPTSTRSVAYSVVVLAPSAP
jgi:transcriptional regulator with XRE-family HTH domain